MTAWEFFGVASTATLLGALVILQVNRRTAPRIRSGTILTEPVRSVSVLVPVRDEMDNLPALLEAWKRVDHPDWELVVLDDGSTDGSLEYLRQVERGFPRLRVLEGSPLPQGWRGKNWACHQLSLQATGELLLFCDADVLPDRMALAETASLMDAERAGMLSGFGRQNSTHPLVACVVSLVVDLPLRAFLPLRLSADRPEPSLVAAVGQWLMFSRDGYRAAGGHRAVASLVSEDLALARRAKRAGVKVVAALAEEVLEVRMYRTPAQAWTGFVKNFADLGGGGLLGWMVSMAFVSWFYALPAILLIAHPAAITLLPTMLLALLVWFASPGASRGFRNLLWFFLGGAFLVGIGLRSALNPIWPVAWKGRVL